MTDWVFTFRMLSKDRVTTGIAITILGVALAANSILFGLIDFVFLSGPAGVSDPSRVVRVYFGQGESQQSGMIGSFAVYHEMKEAVLDTLDLAAFSRTTMTLDAAPSLYEVNVEVVTPGYFAILDVKAQFGALFDPTWSAYSDFRVLVLAHEFWTRQFHADPSAIGKTVRLAHETFTIIGVAPKGFRGTDYGSIDIWIPVAAAPSNPLFGNRLYDRNARWVQIAGRLRSGINLRRAQEAATLAYQRIEGGPQGRIELRPLAQSHGFKSSIASRIMGYSVFVGLAVALVAAANVGSLLLIRALARQREMAIRVALGATGLRLTRQLFIESIVLALLSSGIAFIVSAWSGPIISKLLLRYDLDYSAFVTGRVVSFTVTLTLVTASLATLPIAIQALRINLCRSLQVGGSHVTPMQSPVRLSLAALQVALTFTLLVGATVFLRSLLNIARLDLGIEPENVLVVQSDLQKAGYLPSQILSAYEEMVERVKGFPEIRNAAVATTAPFATGAAVSFRVPGRTSLPYSAGPYFFNAVTADYFSALGIRTLRGRSFRSADEGGRERVAIVNDLMARLIWRGDDPIGTCLLIAGSVDCWRIVGIVEDSRIELILEGAKPQFYIPLRQLNWTALPYTPSVILIRAANKTSRLIQAIQSQLQTIAGDTFVSVRPMETYYSHQLLPWRIGTWIFGLLGGLAFLVSGAGLFATLACTVRERMREFAIRSVLGARPVDLRRLVFATGMIPVLAGCLVGFVLSTVLAKFLAPYLFGVAWYDSVTYGVVAGLVLASALVAFTNPIRRAQDLSPAQTLRSE